MISFTGLSVTQILISFRARLVRRSLPQASFAQVEFVNPRTKYLCAPEGMYSRRHMARNFSIALAVRPLDAIIYSGNVAPTSGTMGTGMRSGPCSGGGTSERGPDLTSPLVVIHIDLNQLSARSLLVRGFAAQISNCNRKSVISHCNQNVPSTARVAAGDLGFLTLIQVFDGPDR